MPILSWVVTQWEDVKGHAKWALLGLIWWVIVTGVRYILNHYTALSPLVVWLILLVVSVWVFVILARSLKNRQVAIQSAGQGGPSNVPVPGTANFDATAFFRAAYYSEITTETEKNARLAAAQNQPNDREGFLAKLIGVGLVGFTHEITWSSIYRSQLLILNDLLRRGALMPLTDAKTYYARAATENPELYRNYSFDGWLNFLVSRQLIIWHQSQMLEMTFMGRDFLKYLTHCGRSPEMRRG